MPAEHTSQRIDSGTVMALLAMGLGVIVIANDFTALNVALTAIEQDFDVDVGTAQWVINAYCLVFGMAIVTGQKTTASCLCSIPPTTATKSSAK